MASNLLTIAIMSDLHPSEGSPGSVDSFLDMNMGWDPLVHPVAGFIELIRRDKLTADLLFCPGDIGNKAVPSSINYGWAQLQKVKAELGAVAVYAVPGNHDHDSRSSFNIFDPKYNLQQLDPAFPFQDHSRNARFWAWHWEGMELDRCRLILLNTSAFHGMNNEYQHGRISPLTLNLLAAYLDRAADQSLNILLCHHHPQRLDEMGMADYQAMEGGTDLLALLNDGLRGSWLLIHGHKHSPRIMYAQSATSQSPVIISAASFSGPIYKELASRVTNQVHIVRVDLDRVEDWGCVAGIVYSWEWAYGIGWQKSESTRGLPHRCGFGYRENSVALARRITEAFHDQPFYSGRELYEKMPELSYLTPEDVRALALTLEKKHRKRLEHIAGTIRQFGDLEDV